MKGTVLQPLGLAVEKYLNPVFPSWGLSGDPAMAMQEMEYWLTRVKTIRVTQTLAGPSESVSLSLNLTKGESLFDNTSGLIYSTEADDERDVFRFQPDQFPTGSYFWSNQFNNGPSSLVGVFTWFRNYLAQSGEDFTQGWATNFNYLTAFDSGVVSSYQDAAPTEEAGLITIQGVDLALTEILGSPTTIVYEHINALWCGAGNGITGSVSVEAIGWFEWKNPAGVPTYNAATGGLA